MAAVGVAGDVSYDAMTTATAVNVTEATSSFAEAELLTTVTVLGVIIVATVTGNTFVIAAVVLERNLRNHVANYLVASLAVADLMVALLVMPLAAVNEVCSPLSLSCSLCLCFSSFQIVCHCWLRHSGLHNLNSCTSLDWYCRLALHSGNHRNDF